MPNLKKLNCNLHIICSFTFVQGTTLLIKHYISNLKNK
jgi:hypothetical protein